MASYLPPEDLRVGNGTETVFGFTFPYLQAQDLALTVDGNAVPVVLVGTAQVSINPAPANGAQIRIYRNTPAQFPEYLFATGVPMLPKYIDENNKQLLYALQEGLLEFDAVAITAQEALALAQLANNIAEQANATAQGSETFLRDSLARVLRVPLTDPQIAALPSVMARAGKVLGFDAAGNPLALLPASGSGTELALDLANELDPYKGVSMVAGAARSVPSIAALRALPRSGSKWAYVYGYYAPGDGGGGFYRQLDITDVTPHNGGTVIVGTDGTRWRLRYDDALSVRQFGARGTGTDDTAAIQATIDTGVPHVLFTSGVYGLGAAGLRGRGKQFWLGTSRSQVTVRMLEAPTLDMIYFSQYQNEIKMSGICFDGNGMLTKGSGNFPSLLPCIHVSECNDVEVVACKFIGFYNMALLINVTKRFRVVDNWLDRGGAESFINHGVGISGESSNGKILNNVCEFTQISLNATHTVIDGNIVSGWGFSAGINTQALASCHTLQITNNVCFDSRQAADVSPYWPAGIENWAADSIIRGNICYGNFGDGIDNGGARCLIEGNICYNNRSYGIFNAYQDENFNASHTVVRNNRMYDTRVGGFRYQLGGYAEQPGLLVGIVFEDNITFNNIGPNVFNCTSRDTAAQVPWVPISTYQNGWVDYGTQWPTAGFYKDTQGIVRLRGAVKSGTVPNIIFSLPVGYRPVGLAYFPVVSNNAFGFVSITPGGGVSIQVGTSPYVTLDGIWFQAA